MQNVKESSTKHYIEHLPQIWYQNILVHVVLIRFNFGIVSTVLYFFFFFIIYQILLVYIYFFNFWLSRILIPKANIHLETNLKLCNQSKNQIIIKESAVVQEQFIGLSQ